MFLIPTLYYVRIEKGGEVLRDRAEDKLVKSRDEAIKEWNEGVTTDWRDALI